MLVVLVAFLTIVASALGAPVFAQKSADALRVAVSEPIWTVIATDDPRPEVSMITSSVFDTLICYDVQHHQFKPLLAESWKWLDDNTIEVKLRKDAKWHDGSPVTADDVVYTLTYLADPASKLRFLSQNLAWFERAEKIDARTVRIITKAKTPLAEVMLAERVAVFPARIYGTYADKRDFGRKNPIGTGPYKVVSVEPANGVWLERNDDYVANDCKPRAKIKRVHVVPIPDAQARVAHLLTGQVDLIQALSKDEVDLFASNPDLAVTSNQPFFFYYLAMDAAGRSGNPALSNLKVRQAIIQAIDREMVARNVLPGGDAVHAVDAVCLPGELGCAWSKPPFPYDPAHAKEILREAGFAEGLDLVITSPIGPGAVLAEAISGQLRKIGIRASVDAVGFAAMRQKQDEGKVQLFLYYYGFMDVSMTADLFIGAPSRDYWRDAVLGKLNDEGKTTFDPEKRKAIYRQFFDRLNEQAYVLPISNKPNVFVHTKELAVPSGDTASSSLYLHQLHWN